MVRVAASVPVVKVVEAVLAGEVGMVALIQGGPLGFRPIGIISPGRRRRAKCVFFLQIDQLVGARELRPWTTPGSSTSENDN